MNDHELSPMPEPYAEEPQLVPGGVDALHEDPADNGLARDLNEFTRFYAKPMRGHGNVTGADNVVSWQTGYPFGVSLGRGYPRFNPGEYTTADTLARGEALARIHAPIGLPIGAVSPSEIAVAIMGEITARLRQVEAA